MNLSYFANVTLHMNIIELPHSDLGLSMRAHPFKNAFELFHVKTSLRELNKNRYSYVISKLVITSAVGP